MFAPGRIAPLWSRIPHLRASGPLPRPHPRRVAHRVSANHNPLAMSARSLSRPGALETELAGVDIPSEARRVGVRQLWLPVPFAVLVSALGQAD
jgi:hypothetical protein